MSVGTDTHSAAGNGSAPVVVGVTISTALLILVLTLVLLGIVVKVLAEVKKKESLVKKKEIIEVPPSQQIIYINHTTSQDTENSTSTTDRMYDTIPDGYSEAHGASEHWYEPGTERDENDRHTYEVNQLEYGAVTRTMGTDQPNSEDTSTAPTTSSEPIPIPKTSNSTYSLQRAPTANDEEYETMQSVQDLPESVVNDNDGYVITLFNDEEDPLYTTVP